LKRDAATKEEGLNELTGQRRAGVKSRLGERFANFSMVSADQAVAAPKKAIQLSKPARTA